MPSHLPPNLVDSICSVCSAPVRYFETKKPTSINIGRWFYKCSACTHFQWGDELPGYPNVPSAPGGVHGGPPSAYHTYSSQATPGWVPPGSAGPSQLTPGPASPRQATPGSFGLSQPGMGTPFTPNRAVPGNIMSSQPTTPSNQHQSVQVECQLLSKEEFGLKTRQYDAAFVSVVKSLDYSLTNRGWDQEQRLWRCKLSSLDHVLDVLSHAGYFVEPPPRPVIDLLLGRSTKVHLCGEHEVEQRISSNIPEELWSRLFPFQKEGVRFALSRQGRVLLADEMGLGKTVQAICCAACYPEDWPLLVVCPSSLRWVWRGALQEWLPPALQVEPHNCWVVSTGKDLQSKLASGIPLGAPHICITSYDLVQKMGNAVDQYGIIICDESHNLKSVTAMRTKFLQSVVKQKRRAVLITGTPLLSRPIEMYAQIDMLCPGLVGSYQSYGERYCQSPQTYSPFPGQQFRGSSNLVELNLVLNTAMMIRRLKEDVMSQLPDKMRIKILVDVEEAMVPQLEECQRDMDKLEEDLSIEPTARQNLRDQIMNNYYRATGPAKVKGVMQFVEGLLEKQMKLLLFAHHRTVMDVVEKDLLRVMGLRPGEGFVRIDGSTKDAARKEYVDLFQQDDRCRVALLSITAAGVGLTLTAAQGVVFCELYWNPSSLIQAEDRAHRMGQTSCIQVFYCIAPRTCDDHIWPIISKKLKVVGRTLGGDRELSTSGRALQGSALRPEHWQQEMGHFAQVANMQPAGATPQAGVHSPHRTTRNQTIDEMLRLRQGVLPEAPPKIEDFGFVSDSNGALIAAASTADAGAFGSAFETGPPSERLVECQKQAPHEEKDSVHSPLRNSQGEEEGPKRKRLRPDPAALDSPTHRSDVVEGHGSGSGVGLRASGAEGPTAVRNSLSQDIRSGLPDCPPDHFKTWDEVRQYYSSASHAQEDEGPVVLTGC